jgi:hypothetical protein
VTECDSARERLKLFSSTDESTDEINLYFHPRIKVKSFLPKNSVLIQKVGEKAGVMAIIFTQVGLLRLGNFMSIYLYCHCRAFFSLFTPSCSFSCHNYCKEPPPIPCPHHAIQIHGIIYTGAESTVQVLLGFFVSKLDTGLKVPVLGGVSFFG